ncbi:MAG: DUF2306 domain-containing protein [Maritimibacter sp.]|nr:DUF2306 domain-containing protein [Maritimibacter sp.]
MTRRTTWLLMGLIALPVAIDALRLAFHQQTGADLAHYADHGTFIALHVASGLAFGLLGALQVAPWFRARHLRFHRRAGRLAILAGATAGFTALWLNRVRPPAEGMAKEIGIYVFATLMLAALTIATIQIRRGALACHRAWMLRAYAIGMAPASQVLIGLALFALPGELPVAAAVAGHYAGWIVNLALAEWAIWTGHPRPALPARRASLRHTPAA